MQCRRPQFDHWVGKILLQDSWAPLAAQLVKKKKKICLQCGKPGLDCWEDALEKGTATHSSNSGLEDFMDCIVHRVAKSRTQLSDFHVHVLSMGMETGAATAENGTEGPQKTFTNGTPAGSSNCTSGCGSTGIEIRTSEQSLHPRGPGFHPRSCNEITHAAAKSLLAETQRFHVSQLRSGTANKQINKERLPRWFSG